MSEIKNLENLVRLKEMLRAGEKGDAVYFATKLGVSKSTFYRLVNYLEKINNLKISYNRAEKSYYLE